MRDYDRRQGRFGDVAGNRYLDGDWPIQRCLEVTGCIISIGYVDVPPSDAGPPVLPAWSFLPVKIVSASFWFLAGATASAILASRINGDVRQTHVSHRVRDAAWLGVGLGL